MPDPGDICGAMGDELGTGGLPSESGARGVSGCRALALASINLIRSAFTVDGVPYLIRVLSDGEEEEPGLPSGNAKSPRESCATASVGPSIIVSNIANILSS